MAQKFFCFLHVGWKIIGTNFWNSLTNESFEPSYRSRFAWWILNRCFTCLHTWVWCFLERVWCWQLLCLLLFYTCQWRTSFGRWEKIGRERYLQTVSSNLNQYAGDWSFRYKYSGHRKSCTSSSQGESSRTTKLLPSGCIVSIFFFFSFLFRPWRKFDFLVFIFGFFVEFFGKKLCQKIAFGADWISWSRGWKMFHSLFFF